MLLNSRLCNADWFYIKLPNGLVSSLSAHVFEIYLERKITASKTRISMIPVIYETVIFPV